MADERVVTALCRFTTPADCSSAAQAPMWAAVATAAVQHVCQWAPSSLADVMRVIAQTPGAAGAASLLHAARCAARWEVVPVMLAALQVRSSPDPRGEVVHVVLQGLHMDQAAAVLGAALRLLGHWVAGCSFEEWPQSGAARPQAVVAAVLAACKQCVDTSALCNSWVMVEALQWLHRHSGYVAHALRGCSTDERSWMEGTVGLIVAAQERAIPNVFGALAVVLDATDDSCRSLSAVCLPQVLARIADHVGGTRPFTTARELCVTVECCLRLLPHGDAQAILHTRHVFYGIVGLSWSHRHRMSRILAAFPHTVVQ